MSTIYRIEGDMLCEQPTMEEPYTLPYGTPIDSPDMRYWQEYCIKYDKHKKSLKKYPLGTGWLPADLNRDITESEFEVKYQMNDFENTDDEKKWINCTHHQYNKRGTMSRRIVANKLPVQENNIDTPGEEGSAYHNQELNKVKKYDLNPVFEYLKSQQQYEYAEIVRSVVLEIAKFQQESSYLRPKAEDNFTHYYMPTFLKDTIIAANNGMVEYFRQHNYRDLYGMWQQIFEIAKQTKIDAPSAQPSDAVEFAEWAGIEMWEYDLGSKIWMKAYDDGIHDQWTTEELYKLFKQQP